MKKLLLIFLFIVANISGFFFTEGANNAYPQLEIIFDSLVLPENQSTVLSQEAVSSILDGAAASQLNMFELLDCFYRYLSLHNKRVEISGETLRALQTTFSYGGHPVVLLLPIDRVVKIQTGAVFTEEEKALDIYLDGPYSAYVDVATAVYKQRCGFEKLEPLMFSKAYGMEIKKWGIKKQLDRIHLYEPLKAAVYAKKFYKPKRWHFEPVGKREEPVSVVTE